ncbi:futalosine hydrolase [Kitasatospora sp. NBC_00240]|uniref:futalosine hydrolase n=1 Tax=Kitasatospora sp. NBC_00240 TaxID=2903567 RepID=UPI00225A5564|nr:futalosine hydrolase [Kitasatospora sp. NBC_00240]MCX5211285.1 futalosine hydrolase [Kitasatospora sp. NBC_00240]
MTTRTSDTEQPGLPQARLLVVVAVPAEAEAVLRGLGDDARPLPLPLPGGVLHRAVRAGTGVDVLAAGVGPAAAAAGAATALALHRYDLVVSAGIAGGFAPHAPIGSVVVADAIVAADLGAETPEGFADVTALGFGTVRHAPPPAAARAAAEALRAAGLAVATGAVLTVSTVTGSAGRAEELAARHPGAAAEAMEGFGVAEAAARHGLPVLEVRTVSNAVGPRDRSAWRIGEALAALAGVFAALPYPELLKEVHRG